MYMYYSHLSGSSMHAHLNVHYKSDLAFSAKALIYLSKALIITKYDKRQHF